MTLQNQGGYKQAIDKYNQSSQDSRPEMVSLPEYVIQQMADSGSVIPVGACIEADHFDTTPFLPRVLLAYRTERCAVVDAVQRQRPRPLLQQGPVREGRTRPRRPAAELDQLRATSQQLVSSGAAGYGIALDSGADSGGGWFLEQWFARLDEPYANNGNGRQARATEVLFDGPTGVDLLTNVQ